jgi:hypothetical protein
MQPHKKAQTIVNRFTVEKLSGAASGTFVGDEGQIFYDPTIGDLRISDDLTPGGIPLLEAMQSAPYNPNPDGTANTSGPVPNNGSVVELTGLQNIGDVKQGFQIVDHFGWVLLNGRAVSLLSPVQQANAGKLGWTSNIPDATGREFKMKGAPGATGGSDTYTLTKANIPNYDMTGSTGSTGINTEDHAGATFGLDGDWLRVGSADVNIGQTSGQAYHYHAVSLNTGGSDQPFNIENLYMSLSAFVYLGD